MAHDILVHMALEGFGGYAAYLAFKQCAHTWHRIVTWLVLALISSYATIQLVG